MQNLLNKTLRVAAAFRPTISGRCSVLNNNMFESVGSSSLVYLDAGYNNVRA